ncbi:hypothetical protein C0J52_25599 [Blattella germanica]|nr:hypothetical protein C0J52_25599 [Blattella germanica]
MEVTDDALLALHSFFGSPFEKALELLETNSVVYLRAPKGRYVIQCGSMENAVSSLHHKVLKSQTHAAIANVLDLMESVSSSIHKTPSPSRHIQPQQDTLHDFGESV